MAHDVWGPVCASDKGGLDSWLLARRVLPPGIGPQESGPLLGRVRSGPVPERPWLWPVGPRLFRYWSLWGPGGRAWGGSPVGRVPG